MFICCVIKGSRVPKKTTLLIDYRGISCKNKLISYCCILASQKWPNGKTIYRYIYWVFKNRMVLILMAVYIFKSSVINKDSPSSSVNGQYQFNLVQYKKKQ